LNILKFLLEMLDLVNTLFCLSFKNEEIANIFNNSMVSLGGCSQTTSTLDFGSSKLSKISISSSHEMPLSITWSNVKNKYVSKFFL
jgi:hypothetical protein